jgi:hypothetical protein
MTADEAKARFAQTLAATGPAYPAHEQALVARGDEVALAALLRQHAAADVALPRLLAQVVLAWRTPVQADFAAALQYFETVPARLARTPVGKPRPDGVEGYLTKNFGNRLTKLLALRLVKQTDWPAWQVMGVLFYLRKHRDPETTAALVRFALTTAQDEWRDYALDTLRELQDAALARKVAAEIALARAEERAIPPAVRALEEDR